MNDLFLRYMSDRLVADYEHPLVATPSAGPGPVITISRDTGCSASVIAKLLYDRIQSNFFTDKRNPGPWTMVDKEVLHLAAQKLKISPLELSYVFKDVEKSAIREVFESMSDRYYHSDRKIKRIVANVMRGMAERGHVIIVGRGAVSVTRDMKNSLHVRLVAPLEWRIEQVANRHGFSSEKAAEYIKESDEKRTKLIECFGSKFDYTLFDVSYNTASLKPEEIVDQIFCISKHKGFFQ